MATITITLLSFSLPFLFVCRISRTISQGSKFHTELLFFSVTGLGVSLSNHKFPFSDCVFHRFKHWFMWSFYLFVHWFSKIVGNRKVHQRVTIIYLQVNNLFANVVRIIIWCFLAFQISSDLFDICYPNHIAKTDAEDSSAQCKDANFILYFHWCLMQSFNSNLTSSHRCYWMINSHCSWLHNKREAHIQAILHKEDQ